MKKLNLKLKQLEDERLEIKRLLHLALVLQSFAGFLEEQVTRIEGDAPGSILTQEERKQLEETCGAARSIHRKFAAVTSTATARELVRKNREKEIVSANLVS